MSARRSLAEPRRGGQVDHPRLREVVAKAEAKILAHGYRFIALGSDAGLIAGAAQRMVQTIRA